MTGAGTITLTGGPFLLPADTNGTARRADTNTYMGTKSGLAGKQASGNYVTALTGDGTASGPGPVALTLATVNSNVGTFGSATQSAVITVNGKGLGTAVSNTTITPAVGSITGLGTGIGTWLATPSSANLAAAITDETGSGLSVFGTSPTLVTPILGTPTSGNLANCTFPTLNQNTTGSAASLTTPRAINGVNFDGTAAITVTAAAGTLTGATLASNVTASSLTSLGTITSGGLGTGAVIGGVTMTLGSDATNDMYYRNSSGVFTRFASANNGVLITSGAGVPSISATLPSGITLVAPALGTPASGTLTNCTFPTLNQNTTGSAASLTTGRTISVTGDLAYTSPSFDGTGNVTAAGTIANNAVTNAKIANTTIDLAAKVTGLLPFANGGLNANLTASNGGLLYSSATAGVIGPVGSTGQIVRSGGAGAYTWSTATYPATAGTSGNFLKSDGTNIVSVASGLDTGYVKYGWYAVAAGDSAICWEVREGNCVIREARAIRLGGTSASINITKNGSSDLLTANYATTTSVASAGTLQNNTLAVGDLIRTTIRAISGTVTEIYIQLTFDKPKR